MFAFCTFVAIRNGIQRKRYKKRKLEEENKHRKSLGLKPKSMFDKILDKKLDAKVKEFEEKISMGVDNTKAEKIMLWPQLLSLWIFTRFVVIPLEQFINKKKIELVNR